MALLTKPLELNDFPDEVLEKILLEAAALAILEDRPAETLKLVCRRWKVIVSGDVFRRLLKATVCSVDPTRRYVNNLGKPLRVLGVEMVNVMEMTAMNGELFVYDASRHCFVVYGHAKLTEWGCRLPLSQKSVTVAEKRCLALRLPDTDYYSIDLLSSCIANNSLYIYACGTIDTSHIIIRTDASNGETTRIHNGGQELDMKVAASGHVIVVLYKEGNTVYEYTENGELARIVDIMALFPNARHWRIMSAESNNYLIYLVYPGVHDSSKSYRLAGVSDGKGVLLGSPTCSFDRSMRLVDADDDGLFVAFDRLFRRIRLFGTDLGRLRDIGNLRYPYSPVAYDRQCGLLYVEGQDTLKAIRLTRV